MVVMTRDKTGKTTTAECLMVQMEASISSWVDPTKVLIDWDREYAAMDLERGVKVIRTVPER